MGKSKYIRLSRLAFILASVGLLALALAAPSAFALPTTSVTEPAIPHSDLAVPPSVLPVIVLQGSDYNMGYQYYQQVNQLFGSSVLKAMQVPGGFTDQQLLALKAYQWYIQKYTPEYIQMFEGMAAFCGDAQNYMAAEGEYWGEMAAMGYPQPFVGVGFPAFDLVSDYFRSLRGSTLDMYRQPDKLLAMIDEQRVDLIILARIGALNTIDTVAHRRDALWQVEKAGRPVGPLLRGIAERDQDAMPLAAMITDERLSADFSGIGLTTGPHPFAYQRSSLRAMGCRTAADLIHCAQNTMIHIAGCVIARQRPGTAKGFVFLSLEDETGIANIILTPDLFERERLTVTRHRFLLVEGLLQNKDGVVHVKAMAIAPLQMPEVANSSHDFH